MPTDFTQKNNEYASPNLLHCFAANVKFSQLLKALDPNEQDNFNINEVYINDFLFGSSEQGQIRRHVFEDLPMNVYLCVKVIIKYHCLASKQRQDRLAQVVLQGFLRNDRPRVCSDHWLRLDSDVQIDQQNNHAHDHIRERGRSLRWNRGYRW